jgi:hypothetical protein
MRQRALDVVQDALNGRQVLFVQVVHVKTHLLNGVGVVRACEGEVPESPGETAVFSRVGPGRAGRSGELGRCVDRCHGRLSCRNAHSESHSDPHDICTLSLIYQLPNCNLFTQHVVIYLMERHH